MFPSADVFLRGSHRPPGDDPRLRLPNPVNLVKNFPFRIPSAANSVVPLAASVQNQSPIPPFSNLEDLEI